MQPVDDKTFEFIRQAYQYNHNLPLETKKVGEWAWRMPYFTEKVLFRSTHNQQVSAFFSRPLGLKKKRPAIVLVHGHNTIWGRFEDWPTDWREVLTGAGYVVLSADNYNFGERRFAPTKWYSKFDFHRREMVMQAVVDAMRGIDYLRKRPEVDNNRIAVMGGSFGAYVAAAVAALDRRAKAVVLTVTGPLHNTDPQGPMMMAHNANFFPRIAPTPLLVVNGKKDEVFPANSAKELFALAGEPKKMVWRNTPHYMPPKKHNREILAWLKENL